MAAAVSEELLTLPGDDREKVFQDSVEQVGIWASQIDSAFDRVARNLVNAGLAAYVAEWIGLKMRWASHVLHSRDVASENVTLCRRFDIVYLGVVVNVVTDQDRRDAIIELQQFVREDDGSLEVSKGFMDLRRNTEEFANRLGQFIAAQDVELQSEVERLKGHIDSLQSEITALDQKIQAASVALGVTGIIGMAVAGPALAAYHAERNGKANELSGRQNELADLNRRQEALANLRSNTAGVGPDTAIISEKLASFAEIWWAVRSGNVEFQVLLQSAIDAVTKLRFKMETQLARNINTRLQASLDRYASELKNRTAP